MNLSSSPAKQIIYLNLDLYFILFHYLFSLWRTNNIGFHRQTFSLSYKNPDKKTAVCFIIITKIRKRYFKVLVDWIYKFFENRLKFYSGWKEDYKRIISFKGAVSAISSDPPCKDVNARLTTVPLKTLSDQ